MADRKQCEAALRGLAARLEALAREGHPPNTPDRTIMCRIPDLGTSYVAQLRDGGLHDITEGNRAAQITFTLSSDDLVAVTEGRLSVTSAWASGRLRVEASVRDLLRVRSLL
ncbi:SCP2 sterol-binding domain-containing protein [Frankia sp. CNm7]|uniref:SCP2 sterol-binding domain-containing protein n=1 Tax=Frankia nepalensis TaxID=1836974 RepID=A0A937RHB3_9ACTN|nr:alkyl sulfatase C-terminal domain-containing protein [Frankia nepalensis]MBL7502603.1 SCP2 sterol-binding domain-containing protein [Frankia nepalensis]MBL7509374.1 SCP2 sterol-binding domain-containing protein [Frankia nepalensis]MBL7522339.1 SCP2 sterol-binding domain-containing protein [Frankia nepalensis]MBL7628960.1 SCP2 sterol-binding domain-containing protein [Frankia nepalensis]